LEPLLVACKYLSDEKRQDYSLILNIIPPQTRVLDLGCGTGELIERLSREKSAQTRGVDLSEENVRACIARGLSVRQGNIEDGLRDYPEGEFDYVILSQTLPYLDNPSAVVKEMLRVGRRAIISFENAGYWVDAFNAGLGKGWGPTLVSGGPRARAITLEQFEAFAQKIGAVIERAEYFCLGKPLGESEELAELLKKSDSGLSAKAAPAWLADTALYVLLKK
jgi:methionine biosynthesis protein MetW